MLTFCRSTTGNNCLLFFDLRETSSWLRCDGYTMLIAPVDVSQSRQGHRRFIYLHAIIRDNVVAVSVDEAVLQERPDRQVPSRY